MARPARDQIHALSIPTHVGTLLVPSATIAEVVNIGESTPVPLAPPWVLGVISWRTLAVPMVSLEAMFGQSAVAPGPVSKAVVFYPLSGREQWEYFAVVSSAEPRPQPVDSSAVTVAAADLPKSPYVAAGLKIGEQTLWIPNFDGFKRAFYST